jgi:hypothetical protein
VISFSKQNDELLQKGKFDSPAELSITAIPIIFINFCFSSFPKFRTRRMKEVDKLTQEKRLIDFIPGIIRRNIIKNIEILKYVNYVFLETGNFCSQGRIQAPPSCKSTSFSLLPPSNQATAPLHLFAYMILSPKPKQHNKQLQAIRPLLLSPRK